MKEKDLMNAKDAAKYIGVSYKTLLTYAKNGIVPFRYGPYKGPNRVMFFKADELDVAVPKLTDVRDIEESIVRYKTELRREEHRLKTNLKALKHEHAASVKMWTKSGLLMKIIASSVKTLSYLGGDLLDSRDTGIILGIINGMTTTEVSEKYGVTIERVRMLLFKVLRRLEEDIPNRIEAKISSLENDKANLEQAVKKLIDENSRLRLSLTKKFGVTTDVLQSTVYARPIRDLYLSVRSGNCLRAIGCETIGDVCSFTEHELMALRAFGVRSLNDVKSKLAELGLALGTTPRVDRLYAYYS